MKIKKLYTNGCSWTFGHGITSDPDFPACETHEEHDIAMGFSWPALMARRLGADLVNDALGGGSNYRIVRTTCDFLRNCNPEEYKDMLVVIGWTAPERNEIYIEYNNKGTWHLFNPSQPFDMQFPKDSDHYPPHVMKDLIDYHKIYTKIIQNDGVDFRRFFDQIYLMSNLLENLGIKYMFFSSIGYPSIKDPNVRHQFSEDFKALSDRRFLGMDRKYSMAEFCNENRVNLSPCIHPMINGHRLWADHLMNEAKMIWPELTDDDR